MLIFLSIYLAMNLVLIRCDIRTGLLPDRFTCPLLWTGLLWHCTLHPPFLVNAVIGAIAGYAGFALIYWGYRFVRHQEGLGYGDIKFLAALGAWHGWQSLPMLVFLAALLAGCAVVTKACLSRRLQALKNPLPFGPFLAAAGLLIGYHTMGLG